jgi:hypothetical protein
MRAPRAAIGGAASDAVPALALMRCCCWRNGDSTLSTIPGREIVSPRRGIRAPGPPLAGSILNYTSGGFPSKRGSGRFAPGLQCVAHAALRNPWGVA